MASSTAVVTDPVGRAGLVSALTLSTRYFHETCQALQLDRESLARAQEFLQQLKQHADVFSVGDLDGHTDEAKRLWTACALFIVTKLDLGHLTDKRGSLITLTHLLLVLDLSVVAFFKEMPNFLSRAAPVLTAAYGADASERLQVQRIQGNFVQMIVLFNHYKKVFFDLFSENRADASLPDNPELRAQEQEERERHHHEQEQGASSSALSSPSASLPSPSAFSPRMQFGWLLFLLLKSHLLPPFPDLIPSTNALLATLVLLIIHMPANLRNFSFQDTTRFPCKDESGKGVDVLRSICHNYKAVTADVARILSSSMQLLPQLLPQLGQPGSLPADGSLEGVAVDPLSYFPGLVHPQAALESHLLLLRSLYAHTLKVHALDIDESIFLSPERATLVGSVESLSPKRTKREREEEVEEVEEEEGVRKERKRQQEEEKMQMGQQAAGEMARAGESSNSGGGVKRKYEESVLRKCSAGSSSDDSGGSAEGQRVDAPVLTPLLTNVPFSHPQQQQQQNQEAGMALSALSPAPAPHLSSPPPLPSALLPPHSPGHARRRPPLHALTTPALSQGAPGIVGGTPLTAALTTAHWLRSVVATASEEPPPKLRKIFQSCDVDLTAEIVRQAGLVATDVFLFVAEQAQGDRRRQAEGNVQKVKEEVKQQQQQELKQEHQVKQDEAAQCSKEEGDKPVEVMEKWVEKHEEKQQGAVKQELHKEGKVDVEQQVEERGGGQGMDLEGEEEHAMKADDGTGTESEVDGHTDVKDESAAVSSWCQARRSDALRLYFRALTRMCSAEAQRLNTMNLTPLLSNARLHRSLIACCAEIVVTAHSGCTALGVPGMLSAGAAGARPSDSSTALPDAADSSSSVKTVARAPSPASPLSFPALLAPARCSPFDAAKAMDCLLRFEDSLPNDMRAHLMQCEETVVDSLGWEAGSPVYAALYAARKGQPIADEVLRQGLLPLPPHPPPPPPPPAAATGSGGGTGAAAGAGGGRGAGRRLSIFGQQERKDKEGAERRTQQEGREEEEDTGKQEVKGEQEGERAFLGGKPAALTIPEGHQALDPGPITPVAAGTPCTPTSSPLRPRSSSPPPSLLEGSPKTPTMLPASVPPPPPLAPLAADLSLSAGAEQTGTRAEAGEGHPPPSPPAHPSPLLQGELPTSAATPPSSSFLSPPLRRREAPPIPSSKLHQLPPSALQSPVPSQALPSLLQSPAFVTPRGKAPLPTSSAAVLSTPCSSSALPNGGGSGGSYAEAQLQMFLHKVLKLSLMRTRLLCNRLKLPPSLADHVPSLIDHVYLVVDHVVVNELQLLFRRHLDQILLCAIYGVCKVTHVPVTFKDIISQYRKMLHSQPSVFRDVLLVPKKQQEEKENGKDGGAQGQVTQEPSTKADVGEGKEGEGNRDGRARGQEEAPRGDIIRFYNEVFVPTVKAFLLQLGPTRPNAAPVSGTAGSAAASAAALDGSADATPKALSPKRVSATHNVYVSPLPSSKVEALLASSPLRPSMSTLLGVANSSNTRVAGGGGPTPMSNSAVSMPLGCFDSPSRDLEAINQRISGSKRLGRLDFGDASGAGAAHTPDRRQQSAFPQSDPGSLSRLGRAPSAGLRLPSPPSPSPASYAPAPAHCGTAPSTVFSASAVGVLGSCPVDPSAAGGGAGTPPARPVHHH